MPDLQNLLDQIDRLDADAEAGPWDLEPAIETQNGWSLGTVRSNTTGESIAADVYNSDGALIALSRTALPALAQAVRAVLKECDRFQKSATSLHENPLADHSDNVRADAWRVMAAFIAEEITDALGATNA